MRFLCWISVFFLFSCTAREEVGNTGEILARTHCGSCHQFPNPNLLNKKSWEESVLPAMALRMGLNANENGNTTLQDQYFHLTENQLIPEKALLSDAEWKQIKDYYLTAAPDSLENHLKT